MMSKGKTVTESKKKDGRASWRHHNFTTAGPVDDYLYSMLPKRDAVLAEMEDYATEHKVPIVGPAVARVLQQLALMINARTVFELGSAIGYSTIWWAQAVGDKGRVIFNDVDKEDYPRVLRLVSPRLRKGGLFITDNALWSGRVAEKNPADATTKAIVEFNRKLYDAKEFYTTILPIRDGLAVAVKK